MSLGDTPAYDFLPDTDNAAKEFRRMIEERQTIEKNEERQFIVDMMVKDFGEGRADVRLRLDRANKSQRVFVPPVLTREDIEQLLNELGATQYSLSDGNSELKVKNPFPMVLK